MEEQSKESLRTQKPPFCAEANGKRSVVVFIIAVLLIVGLTFVVWAVNLVRIFALRIFLIMALIVVYTVVAVFAMRLTGQSRKLLPEKRRLWLQIVIGVGMAAVLCFSFGVLPVLCDTSFIGTHRNISAGRLLLIAIQDILFVGVGEEVVFRGYIQNQFSVWLKKCGFLAPLIAAVFFGLWHIINGGIVQVLFATAIGCVLGYGKYFLKNCTLLSVILAHGLYDFSLVLLSCFMLH